MSTKVIRAGMTLADFAIAASLSRRGSGTFTSPTLGSMVQNGKFAACAAAVRVSALNSVDLPTFGSPTIPIFSAMPRLPGAAPYGGRRAGSTGRVGGEPRLEQVGVAGEPPGGVVRQLAGPVEPAVRGAFGAETDEPQLALDAALRPVALGVGPGLAAPPRAAGGKAP